MKLDIPFEMQLRSFFSWWGEELSSFVPDGLKRFLGQATEYLLVNKDHIGMTLSVVNAKTVHQLAHIPNDIDDVNAVDELRQSHPQLSTLDVVLEVKQSQVLTREIRLPLAAKSNLHQVVAYELDRYTPFTAEQVYYDVQITGKDTETGQLSAQLALIPRQKLDDLCAELIDCGLQPTVARLVEEDEQSPAFNLLPAEFRPKKRSISKIINAAIATLLLLLLLGLLLVPLWSEKRVVAELEREVKAVSEVANQVQTLQQSLETQLQETNFLLDQKRAQPVLIHMFNDLTKRIPDGTWLTYLQYKDGNLQVRGESPDASSLIALVEASSVFQNTRFVSPVTRNTASNTDRFQLAMDVLNGGVFDRKPE